MWFIKPWMEAAKFNLEIQSVVSMRLMKIAAGGAEAAAEYVRMIQEKSAAAVAAQTSRKRQEHQGGDESGNGSGEEKGSRQSQAVIRGTQSETILSQGSSARVRADDPAAGAHHARAKGRHRHVVWPRARAHDRPVVVVPAWHVEGEHAVGAPIALDETSHDHRRHRRARDAGVLPIRVAGGAEQQDALRDAQPWGRGCHGLRRSLATEHVAG
jgi:hypothetical protein